MADVARLIVAVGGNTRELEAAFARSTRRVQAFADATASIGQSLTATATAPALAAAAAIGVATAKMDSLKRGLQSVAGSAAGTTQQLARLTQIAKAPGIGFAEAIQGSVRLQAVGFSAKLAERSLKGFANAIALTGGGRDELARVTVQLGQLAAKGKVLTQDLRPIIEAAPAVGTALRQAFGTINAEDIEKLGLTSEQFLDKLLSQMEKLPQATGGLANAWENLKDTMFRALAGAGEDQTGVLTNALNSLSARVESLGKSFAALAPWQQKAIFLFVGAAAATGPLLIGLSALANAYRTLAAISLVSSTLASVRAFVALVPAVRSARDAMVLASIAARGLSAAMLGPLGIVLAIGAAAAAWVHFKNKALEAARETEAAAEKMTQALLGVDDAVAKGMLQQKNVSTAALMRGMQQLRVEAEKTKSELRTFGVDPDTPNLRLPRQDPTVALLRGRLEQQQAALKGSEALLQTRIAELKVLSADVAARATAANASTGLGGGGDTGEGDRFKELRKQVEALSEGVRLRLDDSRLIGEALALERALAAQAGLTNQSLQDRVTLLGLSAQLAEAARSRLEGPDVDITPARSTKGVDPIARGLEIINREGAPARAKLQAMAKEAERIAKSMQKLDDLTRFADSLARTLSNFGGFGRGLAEMVSRIGDATDAMKRLRESQAATGEGGIFANLGNLTSALGVAGAAIGALKGVFGGLFGGGEDAKEQKQRLAANTDALERLSSRLDALAGTADETRRAQIAAGKLAANAAAIGAAGFFSKNNQIELVNKLIADLGISFADLKRIAEDLGIDLIKDNGKIAADALDELAKALGFHVKILTELGTDLDAFRRTQDAAAKLYNLEDTPQRALNEALEELRKFAPELMTGVLSGIDVNASGGRAALQKALQELFEKIRAGGINLSDLGSFTDVAQLLESLLRADGALDRFSETAEKATAAMLNVPQGFKVALEAFRSTTADRQRSSPSIPIPASSAGSGGGATAYTAQPLTIPITIISADDPERMYAGFYDVFQQKATAYPAARGVASALPPPSRS
jgi:tape measure domain-containing protein